METVLFEIAVTASGLRFRIGPRLRVVLRRPSVWRYRMHFKIWYRRKLGFNTPLFYAYWDEQMRDSLKEAWALADDCAHIAFSLLIQYETKTPHQIRAVLGDLAKNMSEVRTKIGKHDCKEDHYDPTQDGHLYETQAMPLLW